MLKKLAELKVNKQADYYGEIIKTLEEKGFTIVEDLNTTSDIYYSIAKQGEQE